LEALVDIMEGHILVTAHSYRSDEIMMLMRVAERFGFHINSFTHVLEGYQVADEIAAHGAGGSTFSDWWQYKLEAYDAIPYNAAVMFEHGVKTAINSDEPALQPFMVYEFNKPVKYGGVSREDALRMLTRYPAEMLHIDDMVGSIEPGKQGDVVLLSGDPFDSFTRVEKTIVDGIVYYDRSHEVEKRGRPLRPMPSGDLIPEIATALPDVSRTVGSPSMLGFGTLQGPVVALVGATVHPASRPAIENGVVVIENGRIASVGASGAVTVPAGGQPCREARLSRHDRPVYAARLVGVRPGGVGAGPAGGGTLQSQPPHPRWGTSAIGGYPRGTGQRDHGRAHRAEQWGDPRDGISHPTQG
jgi:Amidohydrolase family